MRVFNAWGRSESRRSRRCSRGIQIFNLDTNNVGDPRQKLPELAFVGQHGFRVLKYFPFGGVKRLDLVTDFFNLLNRANVSEVDPVFGSALQPIRYLDNPLPEAVPAKSSSRWILSFDC
ncbi:MAG TPA: hypothetical protein VF748_17350 [Candidatus Acidoferrum sp.]